MLRCSRCSGTKKIAPLGGIKIECNICHGVGMVKAESLQAGIALCETSEVKPLSKGEFHTISEISENSTTISQAIVNTDADIAQKIRNKPGRKPGWNKVVNPV